MDGIFLSRRERRLWICTLATLAAVYSTLALSPLLLNALAGTDPAPLVFGGGVALVAVALLALALGNRGQSGSSRAKIVRMGIGLGVAAVYLLVLARLTSAAARTHLIEYSVLAALIREALLERKASGGRVPLPSAIAFGVAALAGALDEGIQWFVPDRSFDLRDMLFNGIAAAMGIGASAAPGGRRNRPMAKARDLAEPEHRNRNKPQPQSPDNDRNQAQPQ